MPDQHSSARRGPSPVPVAVRAATPGDAVAIAAVAAMVWPDEALDATAIEGLIVETARATSVAVLHGNVVGFVDAFVTETADGEPRCEVDLLAVSPGAQGHGIGRALVKAIVESSLAADARNARGLIRVGNVASERVFGACGFFPDDGMSQLWISDTLTASGARGLLHVVPVRTFRYEGSWLESVTTEGLATLRPGNSSGVTGVVISANDHDAIVTASALGMRLEGAFRFWQRRL